MTFKGIKKYQKFTETLRKRKNVTKLQLVPLKKRQILEGEMFPFVVYILKLSVWVTLYGD